MKVKFYMQGGWTVEVHTPMRKNIVVGTTTGYGLRVKMPKQTQLGWRSVVGVGLEAEMEDMLYENCGLANCVSIRRGKGSKGRPCADPSTEFLDGKAYSIYVSGNEVERVWKIRNEWKRFRNMMHGPGLRSIQIGRMRKKAEMKRMRRDAMAVDAFRRYANVPDNHRDKIIELMYDII